MCGLVPFDERQAMNKSIKIITPAVALLAFVTPPAAQAQNAAATSLPVVVSDEELNELRGGFVWSGLDINFGADIRTYVDGNLVLQTVLNWTDGGVETLQTAANGLSPVDSATLQNNIYSAGGIRMKVGDSPVYVLNDGRTALTHETENGLQNMLINTAVGLNSVQEVNATIDLSGYQQFNSELMFDRLNSTLDNIAGQAAVGALGG